MVRRQTPKGVPVEVPLTGRPEISSQAKGTTPRGCELAGVSHRTRLSSASGAEVSLGCQRSVTLSTDAVGLRRAVGPPSGSVRISPMASAAAWSLAGLKWA